jgi:hypothetical protein
MIEMKQRELDQALAVASGCHVAETEGSKSIESAEVSKKTEGTHTSVSINGDDNTAVETSVDSVSTVARASSTTTGAIVSLSSSSDSAEVRVVALRVELAFMLLESGNTFLAKESFALASSQALTYSISDQFQVSAVLGCYSFINIIRDKLMYIYSIAWCH